MHGQSFDDFPHVARWFFAMAERPAVSRAQMLGIDDPSGEIRSLYSQKFYDLPIDFAADQTKVR
jgi:GST-like protein